MKSKNIVFVISIIIVAAIAATMICVYFFSNRQNGKNSESVQDELSRAKLFIQDWYKELSDKKGCSIYLNELSFQNGTYTLTFAQNRIRAVYPRGERFFKLEHITKVEFFEIDNVLRCRFSYGENDEYMFRISG